MRRSKWSSSLVAGLLVVAMAGSITGLLGAPGTSIRITSPSAGARVSGVVQVSASVKTSDSISYVILGVDNDRPQSTNSAPYAFELDTRALSDGQHRIFVEAYDRYGLVGSSKVITIYVKNGAAAPVQAPKTSPTRVAAKPPAGPPVRAAAGRKSDSAAQTAALPADVEHAASVSPMMSGRGPLPAPTHAAAEPKMTAERPSGLSVKAVGGLPSGVVSSTPPRPATAIARTRGHTVVLNGRPVEFDVVPFIAQGRMQVGFRAMFETVGAVVSWLPQTRTARSVRGDLTVEVPIGERLARVSGREMDIGAVATIREGRTMVPVRFVASTVGAAVHWDGQTRIASVHTKTRTVAERSPGS